MRLWLKKDSRAADVGRWAYSGVGGKVEVVGKSDEEPMIIMSDLLQVSWRKLLCIQDFISKRQLITMECVSEVRDLVEM